MAALAVRLFHLYPDAMNLYGDLGNVLTLKRRCEWRGIGFEITDVKVGDHVDFSGADIVFMGGGQDRGQKIVGGDLLTRGPALIERVEEGMAALTICGGFQLFGRYFRTVDGTQIDGIGLFDAYTVGGTKRLIGNIVVDIAETSGSWSPAFRYSAGGDDSGSAGPTVAPTTLVGFENHSGVTELGPGAVPFGRVVAGAGNNGRDGNEGARRDNVFATYLHGPVLPKNPWLADILVRFGEERHARLIANRIVRERGRAPIRTAARLADVIRAAVPPRYRYGRIHPATRSFQALRIAVNRELEQLEQGLAAAFRVLAPGGRIGVISFHSLEDGAVKRFFRGLARDCTCPPEFPVCRCGGRRELRLVTVKAVQPGDAEVARNPASRSARLRVAEKEAA